MITNDELEKFTLNFSRCANRDEALSKNAPDTSLQVNEYTSIPAVRVHRHTGIIQRELFNSRS